MDDLVTARLREACERLIWVMGCQELEVCHRELAGQAGLEEMKSGRAQCLEARRKG